VTATSAPARHEAVRPAAPARARLTWVTWRQHRVTLVTLLILLAGCASAFIVTGLNMSAATGRLTRAGCGDVSSLTVPVGSHCGRLVTALFQAGKPLDVNLTLVVICLAVFPAVVGVFAGAPLLAREYEAGTYRFAWTQAASPVRWTVTKLALLGGALAAAAAAFGWLVSWWLLLADPLPTILGSRWSHGQFGLTAITFGGWVLLSFAVGVFAGTAIRRVVPAMAAIAVALAALSGITYWKLNGWLAGLDAVVRHARESFTTAYNSLANSVPELPGGGVVLTPARSWPVSAWLTGPHGQVIDQNTVSSLWSLKAPAQAAWIAHRHFTLWVSYQPAGRFWLLQSVEGGACLLLALLLGAATVWMAARRAA
jgi:hypothetical protein